MFSLFFKKSDVDCKAHLPRAMHNIKFLFIS